MPKIKTVALIGLGAIGCALAPGLEQAVGHENFRVIAGGARRERLETKGVTINGVNHRFSIVSPEEACEPADLVIVIVKHGALPQAIRDIRNQVGERTTIISFMNGITSEEDLAAAYGWEHVLYGITRKSVVMQDGVCTYDPKNGYFIFGEAQNTAPYTERVRDVIDLFERAEIPYQVHPDMVQMRWIKFMCNVSENQISALLGIPFGAWHDENSHASILREMACREVVALAKAFGVEIGEDVLEAQRRVLKGVPYPNCTSMLQDVENGRQTEVEMFAGTVCRLGREKGVPTPVNDLFYEMLQVIEDKRTGRIHR